MSICTCECPDGPNEHLENCCVYLTEEQRDILREIISIFVCFHGGPDSDRTLALEMIEYTLTLAKTMENSKSITDPSQVVKTYMVNQGVNL